MDQAWNLLPVKRITDESRWQITALREDTQFLLDYSARTPPSSRLQRGDLRMANRSFDRGQDNSARRRGEKLQRG